MTATHRGGDRFAAGDFNKALGNYQDQLLACRNDEPAEVYVARSYEALGNKVAAINLYRKVADSNSATVSDAQDEAKAALLRLQAARMPYPTPLWPLRDLVPLPSREGLGVRLPGIDSTFDLHSSSL